VVAPLCQLDVKHENIIHTPPLFFILSDSTCSKVGLKPYGLIGAYYF